MASCAEDRALRVAVVAGETSGDLLGGELLAALRRRFDRVEAEGIGGPAMRAQGLRSHYPMESLSVLGPAEVARRYPGLLLQRRALGRRLLRSRPDVFIGIDAPEYNLGLAALLRRGGIVTVQYGSPAIWAWRPGRVSGIGRAVDLVLTLFPFETEHYDRAGVPSRHVGHPLVDRVAQTPRSRHCRRTLGIDEAARVLAVLPGSRPAEVRRLARPMLETARWLAERLPSLEFVTPLAPGAAGRLFNAALARWGAGLTWTRVAGPSLSALSAADAVLLASGTATLEAALLEKPMVVAYRVSPVSYVVLRRLVRVSHVALPNILAGKAVVPELLQGAATPQRMGESLLGLLKADVLEPEVRDGYARIRSSLGRNGGSRAAGAIAELLQ